MKSIAENERFHRMGELVVELVKIAHPEADVSYLYDEDLELYQFAVDGLVYDVNVNWDSTQAGLKDIAKQFLSVDICTM